MKVKDVLNCSFQSWYENFKHVTIESIFLPLPEGFREYLLADGVVLPEFKDQETQVVDDDNDLVSEDNENWENSSDDDAVKAPKFEEFDEKIKEAISTLNGKVFPKLNWSGAHDASWIALNNSCCCTSVRDIYLLLKSSEFIAHDISHPFHLCDDYESHRNESANSDEVVPYFLVLRKWMEINPNSEFRCFVNANTLIGISQRDVSMFSSYNLTHKRNIIEDLLDFFNEHIRFQFSSPSYVFDVVRSNTGNICLLDFSPFGESTDSVLFEWSELRNGAMLSGKNYLPEYRCPTCDNGIQPSRMSQYALPRDIIDISSGEDSFKFADLLKLTETRNHDSSSDND